MLRTQASSLAWLVVAAMVTGCYEPADEPQASLDDNDSDGIKNTVDNCPDIANPNQLDFERDRIGDACDVCSLAPGDANGDADGVGDGCDPSNDDKNRLVFFDNFMTAACAVASHRSGAIHRRWSSHRHA
jgi:hypothetical protein